MSEMFDPKYENEPSEVSPIARVRADICYKADSYIDMYFALQEYLERDLGFTAHEAEQHLQYCEAQGVLPQASLYDEQPQLAEDRLRISFYKVWMPMYQLTHTSDEFQAWVPELMAIIAPPEEEDRAHSETDCFGNYQAERKALDEACAVSETCPVKVVTNDLLFNLPQADMSGMDYYMDSEKTRRNTLSLLSAAKAAGIITDVQRNSLEKQYLATYAAHFPRPEASH